MATRKKKTQAKEQIQEVFTHASATDILEDAMERYSKTVIASRAIPDIRDGLKPVSRRSVYVMGNMGLNSKAKHKKTATVTGQVMGFHPHGDSSISDNIAQISRDWIYNTPLVSISGNNGGYDGDAAASPRYTECRLTRPSELLLEDIKNDAVDMVPTYDNETVEPTVLPAKWPVLFVNGANGIAVGTSTNLPPHNPLEMLKAADYINKHPNAKLDKIMEFVPGPDFPTGGTIVGKEGIRKMYETGKGKFITRGSADIRGKEIHITEIPYGTKINKKTLIESLGKAIVSNNLESQVKSIEDGSEGEEIDIVVTLNKANTAKTILNLLYQDSELESNFTANNTAISHGKPVVLPLIDYLKEFVDFRRETITRIYTHELGVKKERLHIVEGFIKMIDIADRVIAVIKKAHGKTASIEAILDESKRDKKFDFSRKQAEAIASMRLYQINAQDLEALQEEEKELNSRINWLEGVLSDDKEMTKEISRQLKETMKDFKDCERKSDIVDEVEEVVVNKADLITPVDVITVVRPYGVQRMTKQVYENNVDDAKEVVCAMENSTDQVVALFTRSGLVMQRIVDEIENNSIRNEATPLSRTVSTFKSDDEIIHAVTCDLKEQDEKNLMVLSVTKMGQVKVSPLADSFLAFTQKGYLTRTRAYNGLKNASKGDEIIAVHVFPKDVLGEVEFSVRKKSGVRRVTKVNAGDINIQGYSGSGARVLSMKPGEKIVITTSNFDKYEVK